MSVPPPGNANLPIGDSKITKATAIAPANQEIGVSGWSSRGYLPHFDGNDTIQHVTFHLADSLPKEVLERLNLEICNLPFDQQDVERRKRIEAWIDAGHGGCILREPVIAEMVQNTFLFFDGQRYRLLAWVVMPNHVHVLLQPLPGWTLARIVASWKKFTAARICAHLFPGNANLPIGAPPSPVWHREYWDRYIRDESHFHQVVAYIHANPVKAGLVMRVEDWQWSSVSSGAPIS